MDVTSLEDGKRSEQSQLGEEHPRTSHKHMDVVAIDLQVEQRGATFVKEVEVVGRHCRSHFFFNLFGNSNLKLIPIPPDGVIFWTANPEFIEMFWHIRR